VEHLSSEELEQEVRAAGMVAHPSVLKVLGLAVSSPDASSRGPSDLYVVSEFIVGAALQQVVDTARHQRRALEAGVRLKIVHDVLVAAHEARRILHRSSQWDVRRTIFPDTVWIADFGAVLLTEVGVSQLLHGSPHSTASSSHVGVVEDADVSAAGALLRLLFSDPDAGLAIPATYRSAIAPILARSEAATGERYADVLEMAGTISELPAAMLASDGEVAEAIGQLMREDLQRQRARLAIIQRGEGSRASLDGLPTFDATERPTENRSAMVPVAEAVERPSREVTRIMPDLRAAVAGSRTPGTGAPDHSNDATDMTRMFVPVFGASGPQATQPATDSQMFPAAPTHEGGASDATMPSATGDADTQLQAEFSDAGASAKVKRIALILVVALLLGLLLFFGVL